MRIEDITPETIKKAENQELYNLAFTRFPQFFKKYFKHTKTAEAQGMTRSDFFKKYRILLAEMSERGLRTSRRTDLHEELFKRTMWAGLDVPALGDLVVVENYVSIGGRFVKNPSLANDVDIIIRDTVSNRDEGLELKLGRILAKETGKNPHFIYSLRGPHSSYIPVFDLVLRAKDKTKRIEIKEGQVEKSRYYEQLDRWDEELLRDNFAVIKELSDGSVLDLGCGTGRLLGILRQSGRRVLGVEINPEAISYCKRKGIDVLKIDLEKEALPLDDNSFDNVIGVHFLEHISNIRNVLNEAQRVAKKKVIFLVPLGERYDPSHQHEFKTAEDFKKFLSEKSKADWKIYRINNSAIALLDTANIVKKAIRPLGDYTPPKPTMAGMTEAFSVDQIWDWAKGRNMIVEPKLNGFRVVLAKEGDKVKIMTEGKKDLTKKFPEIEKKLRSIPDDFLLDASMGIERDGTPLPRIKLMTLMAEKPELEENDVVVFTVFDLPFWKLDMHKMPFIERRKKLEQFYNKYLKSSPHFQITPYTRVSSKQELEAAFRKFQKLPQSEGIVIKDVKSTWDPGGSESGWAKLKKEAEIKVQVIESEKTKDGKNTYVCGVLKGELDYKNVKEFKGEELIVLGKTYATDIKAEPGDILTIGVEEIIPNNKLVWLGPRVIDIDKDRSKPYYAHQVISIAEAANILQKAESFKRPGIYLPKPQATEVIESRRNLIIEGKLPKSHQNKEVALIEDKTIVGLVITLSERKLTDEEKKQLGLDPDKDYYEYKTKTVSKFVPPFGYDPPPGASGPIEEVIIKKARGQEGAGAKEGNIDFKEGDKGTGVLQLHIMGLEEDKAKALKLASSKAKIASADPIKLKSFLLNLIGNHGAHVDIRLKPEGKDYWEGGEIMIGNIEGLDKLKKLDEKNQKLRFAWKVGHRIEGKPSTTIVRGPLDWLTVGSRGVEISEPGEVGATAHKYAAFIQLDKFRWNIYQADEHAKKFHFEGGRYLDGNYLFAFVPVAEGQRIWMMSRLPDDDHEKLEKLDLETFTATGTDSELKAPERNKKKLLAGLRYIGNAGYPRLKEGKEWGDWDLDTALKYFAKIVDALRSTGVPLTPPSRKSPEYKTSFWQCYREAEKYMKSKPPLNSNKLRKAEMMLKIVKADKRKQIVGGIIYEPFVEDTQGDWTTPDEIEKAMHGFMERYSRDPKRIKIEHEGKKYYFPILECFQPEVDTIKDGKKIPAGAWWILIKVKDKNIWDAIERGELTGFSMGGKARAE